MLLHIQDAVQQGQKNTLLRTVDTDVLVLAVAFLQQVTEGEHLDLWVAFGTGNHFQYIAAHEIATKLGPEAPRLDLFSMPLQDVTLCLVLEVEGRKQRLKHGNLTWTLQTYSWH